MTYLFRTSWARVASTYYSSSKCGRLCPFDHLLGNIIFEPFCRVSVLFYDHTLLSGISRGGHNQYIFTFINVREKPIHSTIAFLLAYLSTSCFDKVINAVLSHCRCVTTLARPSIFNKLALSSAQPSRRR